MKLSFVFIIMTLAVSMISCSKGEGNDGGGGGNGGGTGGGGGGGTPQLTSFSVSIIERSYLSAVIRWTASTAPTTQDTVKYKVIFQGVQVDSNLTRLMDTVYCPNFTTTYSGTVIATSISGLTKTASFTIESQQGRLYISDYDHILECDNIFTNGVINPMVWKKTSIPFNASTPTLSNDTVFVSVNSGSSGVFSAYNNVNGNHLWSISPGYSVLDESSITYFQGKLFASTDSGVVCLNSINGSQVWKHVRPNPSSTNLLKSNPVISSSNNKVFVGTKGNSGAIVALNLSNGIQSWEYSLNGQMCQTPVLTGNLVIINAGTNTIALDQNTGALVWQKNGTGRWSNSPILIDNTLIVVNDAGYFSALNPSTGATIWNNVFIAQNGYSCVTAGQGMFFVATNNPSGPFALKLCGFYVSNGQLAWEYQTFLSTLWNLVYADNSVYGYDYGPYNRIWKFNALSGNMEAGYNSGSFWKRFSLIVNNKAYYNIENGNYKY